MSDSVTLWTVACHLSRFSVHGILQARIVEWVAMPSSRGSYQPRDRTRISCICRQVLYPLSQLRSPDGPHVTLKQLHLQRHSSSPPWNEGDPFTYRGLDLPPELAAGRHNSPVTATEFPVSSLCLPHGQPENPSQLPLLGRFTSIAQSRGSRARGQDLPHEADDAPLPRQGAARMSGRDGQIPKRPV